MTALDIFSITTSVVSITLSIVSMWVAFKSVKDSEANYNKTQDLLTSIKETSAKTEAIVGKHFSDLMNTILSIVESASMKPELKKVELQIEEKKMEFAFQKSAQEMIAKVVESGDRERIDLMLNSFERLTKIGNENQ